MARKIYVGNLAFSSTEDEIRELFTQHGTVHSVDLIRDRLTGRSRGFGFVEMDEEEADAAITALNGTTFGERNLRVSVAKQRRGKSEGDRGGGQGGRYS